MNCSLYFPDKPPVKDIQPWTPTFTTGRGTAYYVDDIASDECPKSLLSTRPELQVLLNLISSNQHVRDASGACMFGLDSSKWPAWWGDAVEALEVFTKLERNARAEAEHSDMQRALSSNHHHGR